MKTLRILSSGLLALGSAAILAVPLTGTGARQAGGQAVPIDADDLGGVVTGPKGPEAGVWVIAETTDLPTKFAKIVVTDEQGRYVVPDLPKANYSVWVRGYGLVDSPKTQATPGKALNLTAVVAPNPRAAAEYYPAGYWFSLLRVPDKSEFPGTGPTGNGISPTIGSQAQWLRNVKSGSLLGVPPTGEQGDARAAAESWHVPILGGGVGTPPAVRAGWDADDQRSWPARS